MQHLTGDSMISRFYARILLAEDHIMNQKVAQAILGKYGISIDVNNGKEAIAALENKQYDLVLMDIQMPEMDGIEATKIIRNSNLNLFNHSVPVLAMTANASKTMSECLDVGMNGYISKPIDPDELLAVIKKICQAGRDKDIRISF